MNDQLRRIHLQDVFGSGWVPAAIIVSVSPEGTIELGILVSNSRDKLQGTYVVFNEPQLLCRDLGISNKGSIMAN